MHAEPYRAIALGNTTEVAIVDAADFDLLNQDRWHRNWKGYAVSRIGNRIVRMHRLIMGLDFGDRLEVDHRDRNKLNNCRSNLRFATPAQQRQNVASYRGSTSRYRGVSWFKLGQCWRATATIAGKQHHLGLFHDELEAARVAAEFRRQHMPYSQEAMAA